jgi:hypothetical protein
MTRAMQGNTSGGGPIMAARGNGGWRLGAMEGRERLDLRHEEEKGKRKKENGRFPESFYISRLTDEYRRTVPISHVPLYLSVMPCNR